jgi:S-adenosylmethionine:tRNA ribosyltransferase-isomerase
MNLKNFDYKLDEQLIAKHPPKLRGSTRLLVLNRKSGEIIDSKYAQLYEHLEANDLLVLNNTKVFKARLNSITSEGKNLEILILEQHENNLDKHAFKVMYRGKLKPNQILKVGNYQLKVRKINDDGTALLSSTTDITKLTNDYGTVPLPPYLKREADQKDVLRYQTVIAKEPGSVAAPTASLNITNSLLHKLDDKNISTAELTLHVGLGTFMPIRVDNLEQHKMHKEYFEIPGETINSINKVKVSGTKVVAVGTTVTRALEYSADKILSHTDKYISGEADIFIYPGYEFKVVEAMITNFHAPKSTVLMMSAAFAGWDSLLRAYNHATKEGYKFLSYGDSMLIL